MRLAFIILAVIIGLFGLRLLATALRTLIMFFKVDNIPISAKEGLFRDFFFGLGFLVLSIVMLT